VLKSGIYRHKHQKEYAEGTVDCGDIRLEVHETKTAFVLKLLEQQVRCDAPQIDDLFQNSDRVVIKKDGSKHGMSFCSGQDDWFCLYPYRVGVPYAFTCEGPVMSMTETKRKKEESTMSNPRQKAPAAPEQQKKAEAAPEQQRVALPTEITARAYPKTGNGNILASLTFDVNGCFAVRGAKLVQGKNGPFVSMPQRQTKGGYQEVVFPITKEMREIVNNVAVSAYQLALQEMTKKMADSQQADSQQAAPTAPTEPTM
jgi:stage V sporulation protein G